MINKTARYATALLMIVNVICAIWFLCWSSEAMIKAWHMKYYRDHGYPVAQVGTIFIPSDETGKPVFKHYT